MKVKRTYMYRIGPSNFLLAFGCYLGDPNMKYIYNRSLYKSESELVNSLSFDNRLLNIYKKSGKNSLVSKIQEMAVAKQEVLNDSQMRYPVVILGMEKNAPQKAIDFFENLGYEDLGI